MYQVAVGRDFIAQHYLIGRDWGEENEKHFRHYLLEVQLEGETLDPHGIWYISRRSKTQSSR